MADPSAPSTTKSPCFTLVADDSELLGSSQQYQTQDLRAALEKGTDELKLDTLRRIVTMTLNGQPQVRASLNDWSSRAEEERDGPPGAERGREQLSE